MSSLKEEYLSELAIDNEAYRKYLSGIDAGQDPQRLFFDRQEDQSPEGPGREEDRGRCRAFR